MVTDQAEPPLAKRYDYKAIACLWKLATNTFFKFFFMVIVITDVALMASDSF